MFHINNILKYVGLTVFVYFLIKTFSNNNMTNTQIYVVVGLVVMTVFIMANNNEGSCPRRFAEGYKKKDKKNTSPTTGHTHPTTGHTHSTTGHPTTGHSHDTDDEHESDTDDDYETEENMELKKSVGFRDDVHKKIKEQESKAKQKVISKKKKTKSRTNPLNTVPLGTSHFNYTMMPVENWFRAYDKPPICLPSSNDDDDDEVKPTEHKQTANLMHIHSDTEDN